MIKGVLPLKKFILLSFLVISFIKPISLMAAPSVQAQGAILIETQTNTILYEKNAYARLYPASITKLMTALLVEENLPDDTIITKSQNSVDIVPGDSSSIGLKVGDSYNKTNALYGLLLGSDNYIAHDLALTTSGSISQFAQLMNQKAKVIGAKDTHFVNPHGYHDPNHYTTPYDMAQIAKAAFSNPVIAKIAGTDTYQFYIRNCHTYLPIRNSSRLVKKETPYYNPHVVSCKTGFHNAAGQTLVAKGVYGDLKLIAVVMNEKTPQQYVDVNELFDYAQHTFSIQKQGKHYLLVNHTIPNWAIKSIARAHQLGWLSQGTNYQDPMHTEDLVALLKKAGHAYGGITMSEIKQLTGLKQGMTLNRTQLAQIMTYASRKWKKASLVSLDQASMPTDLDTLSITAKKSITNMLGHQFMSCSNQAFHPYQQATLAEAVIILDRLLT